MPDAIADTALERDAADRMARMAQRLAAAGPRTRQRLLDRQGELRGLDADPGGGWWPRVSVDDRQVVYGQGGIDTDQEPRSTPSDTPGIFDAITLRHVAWISVAAVMGFGAVALGQSPRLSAMLREASRRADPGHGVVAETAQAASAPAPSPAPAATPTQPVQLAAVPPAAKPPAPAAPQADATPPAEHDAASVAQPVSDTPSLQAAPVDDEPAAAATLDAPQNHVAAAKIVRPTVLARAPRLQRAAAFVAVPHREPVMRRQISHVAYAAPRLAPRLHRPPPPHQTVRYQLPRWLTYQPPPSPPPAPPRERIMSPPPQVLTVPQTYFGGYQ